MYNKKVEYEQKGRYTSIPVDYLNALFVNGQRDKASAFMQYFMDMEKGDINAVRFYVKAWGVGRGTVQRWIDEFANELDKYYAYWSLKNEQQRSSAKKQMGQERDKDKKQMGQKKSDEAHQIEEDKKQSDTKEEQMGHKSDKGYNNSNINNINAESNDSASKNKKTIYSKNFEILWNNYDKKSSNKARSQTIYNKRFKNTDIKIILEAIQEYKDNTEAKYIKDFDGFLNGLIDSYIPARAWLRDKTGKKHIGWFYDSRNLFQSDEQKKLRIDGTDISLYIENNRFGFIR